MSIIIFSRPVRSGKTTELIQWCGQHKNVAGIVMPDIEGSRKILDLSSKEMFDIQCMDPEHTTESLTPVGRFHFYTTAFDKANSILLDALVRDPERMIIDEAGKLELEGKGFYPAIKKAVQAYSNKTGPGGLIITVRDSLCEALVRFFDIHNCRVVHRLEEL